MSWENTYSRSVCIGIDRFYSALLFNEPDMTISSLCWLVRNRFTEGVREEVKLYNWQIRVLWHIGAGLEFFFPGHIAVARSNDIKASSRARRVLGAVTP